jgi:creatinine amidohydrolase
MAQHHLGFPGSITLRPSTLIAVIQDQVNSLARHGFDRFYFLNGHGGNIATVNAAFAEIYAETSLGKAGDNGSRLTCRLRNWFESDGVKRISRKRFGAKEGSHATCSEISLTYYAYPEHVKRVEMRPEQAPNGPFTDCYDYRRRFPDGRIGSAPHLAAPEIGRELFDAAVKDIAEDYLGFAEGR